jgi:rubrerythrin
MGRTTENLKAAFAGESQANRKYLAFASRADEEGYTQAAKLFRAAANAETVHALAHLRELGIGTTAENLKAAVAGEHHEAVTMYPGFIAEAEADGESGALRSFRFAWEVEKVHEGLYEKAAENLGHETGAFDYYVCQRCGYTHEASAPEKCPVCGAPAKMFERVG